MVKHPKRPRDPMQLAKLIGDIATGQAPPDQPKVESEETAWRRKGGQKGAKVRAKKLSPARRREIAKKAAMEAGKVDHVWSLEEIARLV